MTYGRHRPELAWTSLHADTARAPELRRLSGGSLPYLALFEQGVRDSLAHHYGARTGLRVTTTRLVATLRANGGEANDLLRLVSHIVLNEAAQGALNRTSIITGARAGDTLIEDIRAWVRTSFRDTP